MLPAQDVKYGVIIADPQTIKDDAAWTTTEIDTLGWDYCEIIACIHDSDIEVATMQVTESDTTGSGHAAVTGLVWGTSTNIDGDTSAKPTATDDDTIQVAHIDLRYRKRYLDLSMTAGDGTAGTYASAIYRLSRGESTPLTMAAMGCDEVLRV